MHPTERIWLCCCRCRSSPLYSLLPTAVGLVPLSGLASLFAVARRCGAGAAVWARLPIRSVPTAVGLCCCWSSPLVRWWPAAVGLLPLSGLVPCSIAARWCGAVVTLGARPLFVGCCSLVVRRCSAAAAVWGSPLFSGVLPRFYWAVPFRSKLIIQVCKPARRPTSSESATDMIKALQERSLR